jgi:hypothetical protein
LIEQYCRHEPEKYGHCVITEPTDCAVHGNGFDGKPATRTLIWHPPYVGIADFKRVTRASGVYEAVKQAKDMKVCRPVVVKKVKPAKKLPARPARKAHVESKRAPKYGPQKYARAA